MKIRIQEPDEIKDTGFDSLVSWNRYSQILENHASLGRSF